MMKWIVPVAAAAIALAPAAFAENAKPDITSPSAGNSDTKLTEHSFVQQALQSGEREIVLAELAAEKSQNAEVKKFAQMIAADHKRVNEQLRLLAQRGAEQKPSEPATNPTATPPPTNPGAAPLAWADKKQLGEISGADLDKAFVKMAVDGHEKSVDLYTRAAQSLPASAAKKLAEDTLPKIKRHLEQAKSLQSEFQEKK